MDLNLEKTYRALPGLVIPDVDLNSDFADNPAKDRLDEESKHSK